MLRRIKHIKLHICFLVVVSSCLVLDCATTSKIPNLATVTPKDIQLKATRNFESLESFEGKARVIIETPGKGYQGYSSVFIKLPDSVFVKTEATLGIDIGALFLDQRFFAAYAPRDNILYYGETETLDLSEFLQIEITTGELFEILTGRNQIILNETSNLTFSGGQFMIDTRLKEQKILYTIDPMKFVVTQSRLIDVNDETILLKEYSRIRKRKGIAMPQIIKLTRPRERERITVYYTSQKVNKTIPSEKFRVKPAKNARRVYWGDISNPVVDPNIGNEVKPNPN